MNLEAINEKINWAAHGGLQEIGSSVSSKYSLGKESVAETTRQNIESFGKLINQTGQPNFFITSSELEELSKGAKLTVDKGYEVFGFLFCIAIRKKVNSSNEGAGNAYFRIRTIYKEKGGSDDNLFVDTQRIAFADLDKAMSTGAKNGTVTFLYDDTDSKQIAMRKVVTDEVYKKAEWKTFGDGILTKGNLQDGNKKSVVISNIGTSIKKDRLIEILKKGPFAEISFALSPVDDKDPIRIIADHKENASRLFYYHIKVNPEYESDLPCPLPFTCT